MRDICLITFRGRRARAGSLPSRWPARPRGDGACACCRTQPRRQRAGSIAQRTSSHPQARATDPDHEQLLHSRSLRAACADTRGASEAPRVRVVLVPHQSDVPAVAYATRRCIRLAARHGYRIFEWSDSYPALEDRRRSTGVVHGRHAQPRLPLVAVQPRDQRVMEDAQVASALAGRIARDIGTSVAIDARAWRFRPLLDRVLEEFFYRFRRVL